MSRAKQTRAIYLEGEIIVQIDLALFFQIDVAFANIWLTQNHYKFVNMSEPWYQLSVQFLVPRPRPITNFWALTRPFSITVWLLLLIMLFVNSTYLCVRARIDPKFPKRKLTLRSIERGARSRALEYSSDK
jgi:hypothetical protein